MASTRPATKRQRARMTGADRFLKGMDDPQPSRSTITTQEEYDADKRARAAKTQAQIDRAEAQSAEARRRRTRAETGPSGPATGSGDKPAPSGRHGPPGGLGDTVGALAPKVLSRAPKGAILAEFLAAMVAITIEEVANKRTPTLQAYLGAFVVYLVLGFAAELGGPQTARVSAGMGGLVLLAILMRAAGPIAASGTVIGETGAGAPPRPSPTRHSFRAKVPIVTSLHHPQPQLSKHVTGR